MKRGWDRVTRKLAVGGHSALEHWAKFGKENTRRSAGAKSDGEVSKGSEVQRGIDLGRKV